MISDQQIEANRLNAQKSTGPRTEDGKEKSKRNAITHGLTAAQVVIPGEDVEDFEDLREALLTDLKPVGALETECVDQVVFAIWRLRRCRQIEAALFVIDPDDDFLPTRISAGSGPKSWARAFLEDGRGANGFARLSRHEKTHLQAFYLALHELERLRAERSRGRTIEATPIPASDSPLLPRPKNGDGEMGSFRKNDPVTGS